jgi:hypothetical protein
MKMVKRTLIAIALVALLSATTNAALTTWNHTAGDHAAVKVDGTQSFTTRWPVSWSYDSIDICTIPVKIHVGMYVQVIDCNKKKIVLEQVPCSEAGKGDGDYPCYKKCIDLQARANFDVVFGCYMTKNDAGNEIIDGWACYYDGGNTISAMAGNQDLKLCVKAWKARLYNHAPGNEVSVGSVTLTVKPQ